MPVSEKAELLTRFESRARRSGRMLLFDPETASELVTAAQAAGVRVLGVDGFRVSADGIQPLQEMELDVEDSPTPYDATRTFLSRVTAPGYMFEVALDDE
jgi:hypothetical protein